MISVTGKNLLKSQKKRLQRMHQQEMENRATQDAKARFRKPPYYIICEKEKRTRPNEHKNL